MSTDLIEEYIASGNGPGIQDLLHSNPRLAEQRTSQGMSPLLLACYYNKPTLARIFAKYLEQLSIFEAAALGMTEEVMQAVDAEPQLAHDVSDHGFSVLGIATQFDQEDIVRFLLSRYADPNQSSMNGFYVFPIHSAIDGGFMSIAKLLLEGGAEVNVKQATGITPLHIAAQRGDIEMIILLLEYGARVELEDELGHTAADLARERGHAEIADILTV